MPVNHLFSTLCSLSECAGNKNSRKRLYVSERKKINGQISTKEHIEDEFCAMFVFIILTVKAFCDVEVY